MNPMTNMKNVLKLSAQELKTNNKTSWHDQYKGSAWIFVGGLPYDLTEGDIISVFSQYGEIVNINLVRDKISGKQKGFCFICYEDQRSTVLAVDNFNGIKVLGRTIRVDHVNDYKPPKDGDKLDEETKKIHRDGCGPVVEHVKIKPEPVFEPEAMIVGGVRLPPRLPIGNIKTEIKTEPDLEEAQKKHKVKKEKRKKEKKRKKSKSNKKRRRKSGDDSDNGDSQDSDSENEAREKRKKK